MNRRATGHLPGPPVHHGTHTKLLRLVPDVSGLPARPVDAIIVPTARPSAYLRSAMQVAHALDSPLLALCSKYAQAQEVMDEAVAAGKNVIAVDVTPAGGLPDMATSKRLAGTRFERRTDTSYKRNVGLAVARMSGWRNVVFLDDDIAVDDPDHLLAASALLETFDAVGLANHGFADNSVVCHARRAVGYQQDSFVGGGAMAVPAHRTRSFFPNIYNEDWFFLLSATKLSTVGVTGRVVQKPFDPYADPRRARSEEFGDCLAEGIFALLDQGRRVQDANEEFWAGFLANRRELVADVLARLPETACSSAGERTRMIEAMTAAQGRQKWITPELCTSYLRDWTLDRTRWQRFIGGLPTLPTAEALGFLGFKPTAADAYRSRGVPATARRSGPRPSR
ncbi:hypothetical protein [Asanoa siamensis]|uniref:hypothetical protein n=1 Tax=Asanoa siamensis TaxID=926357 RepID=UPI00194182AE|nr:hypothetical protein [Asanoa siamensis]